MNIQKRLFFYLTTPDDDYYYSKELTLLFSWLQYQHQLVSALSSSSRDQIRLFYDIQSFCHFQYGCAIREYTCIYIKIENLFTIYPQRAYSRIVVILSLSSADTSSSSSAAAIMTQREL